MESKRKKIPEKIFSGTEEDRRAWGPSQKSPRGPTSPHPAARGARHAGLWVHWRSPDQDLAPINSQIFPKKSRDDRNYFSTAASFCLRKIPSGHVLVPCRRGDSDMEGFFINTMISPMMREQFTIDLRVHIQQLDGFFSLLDLQYKVFHDLHGDLSDVIFFCGVFVEIR